MFLPDKALEESTYLPMAGLRVWGLGFRVGGLGFGV